MSLYNDFTEYTCCFPVYSRDNIGSGRVYGHLEVTQFCEWQNCSENPRVIAASLGSPLLHLSMAKLEAAGGSESLERRH